MADGGIRSSVTHEGRRLELVLAAGKGNVVDTRVANDLAAVLESHRDEATLRAVTIAAEGRHFSFGASVEEHAPELATPMIRGLHAVVIQLVTYPVPVLASVRGCCLGGGLEVVLPADRIFAAPDAKLGLPEVTLGMFAPAGSALLTERVGFGVARELLLAGSLFKADRALSTGLVDVVAEDPDAAMTAWFEKRLLGLSATAVRFARRAAWAGTSQRVLAAIADLEAMFLEELVPSADAQEGVRSFLEKREPRWSDSVEVTS